MKSSAVITSFALCWPLIVASQTPPTGAISSINTGAAPVTSGPAKQDTAKQDAAKQDAAKQDVAKQKVDRSDLASTVLQDTGHARTALKNSDQTGAAQNVKDALAVIGQLQKGNPAGGNSGSNSNMVPIYDEWKQVSIVKPLTTAKQSQDAPAIQSAGSLNREAPESAHQQVSEAAGHYTNVSLDLNMAQNRLQAAQSAISEGNVTAADASLKALQDGLTMVTVPANLPLLEARQNLALADNLVRDGRYDGASAALNAAAKALADYAAAQPAKAEPVNAARQEMTSSASSINQNVAEMDSRIHSWWNLVTDWAQQ
ncbi:MAG: YfdX family protein [Acidobacteriia bacterium]|nr:YfdX family protein [Terriglobia bacterium]